MKHRNVINVFAYMLLLLSAMYIVSCRDEMSAPTAPVGAKQSGAAVNKALVTTPDGGTEEPTGNTTAYYDAKLFTINLKEMPSNAENATIAHNPGINTIYMSGNDEAPNSQSFINVIDAIQTDGFNPLWREVEITFNTGFPPHQFFSDDEVNAAASGTNPEISLTVTNEIYRCAVIGPKH